MGSGIVPFERAFVSSYRSSIVTFPLSLRVSELLPLLFSRTPLFSTPPLVSPKFPHVILGVRRSPYGCKEQRCWLLARAISFQDFQPMWSQITNVTDRRTDRRTTCDRKTALCTKVHCAVKKLGLHNKPEAEMTCSNRKRGLLLKVLREVKYITPVKTIT